MANANVVCKCSSGKFELINPAYSCSCGYETILSLLIEDDQDVVFSSNNGLSKDPKDPVASHELV